MVASPQIEQRLAFEPRSAAVEPTAQTDGNARGTNRTASGNVPSTQRTNGSNPAYSVEISDEAQRIAANDPGNTPRPEAPQAGPPESGTRQDLNATVETSATTSIDAAVGGTRDDGSTTNQVTSFESERTGNDTRNDTEAGRTLGQVIDTFA